MSHNLNIHDYNFQELLELFDIQGEVNVESLKRAKKKVLMTHPDKSKLPNEYFLFYKKAYEMIYYCYENMIKQNKVLPQDSVYMPDNENSQIKGQITQHMEKTNNKEFQKQFNKLFEEHMSKKIINKNEWFQNEDPLYESTKGRNINDAMEQMKNKQALIKRTDIANMRSSLGTDLYEDEHDDSYITCDPFSKLKFDDLRKVHKDETMININSNTIQNHMNKAHGSLDSLRNSRSENYNPLPKEEGQKMLSSMERKRELYLQQQQYQENLNSMKYEQKNKEIMGKFLHITY